jgi:hypothetical protein
MSTIVAFDDELSIVELEGECAMELPARHLMSLINVSVVNAINLSTALNVLTQGSTAASSAAQQFSITQF